jgi:hypothetical protein
MAAVLFSGWSPEMRMPTRDVLDVAKDHPVMFDAS